MDWILNPIGNTGKSSFALYYMSKELPNGVFMKIDNLDRMELTLIKKIENYRLKYHKDPKVLLFDFSRLSDMGKIFSATALMEDAKSGYLETTFGRTHKEIQVGDIHVVVSSNSCPDLSILSVDRWRLWTLSEKNFGNIIWPVTVKPWIKKVKTAIFYYYFLKCFNWFRLIKITACKIHITKIERTIITPELIL